MGELARGMRGGRRAELAAARLLVSGIAVTVVMSSITTFVVADPQGRVELPGWFSVVTGAAFAVLVVVGAASAWVGVRALRVGAAAGVAIFFLALVLFAPASGVLDGTATAGTVPWVLTAVGGFAVAAVVAGGPGLGWAAILAWAGLLATYRVALGGYSMTGLANDAQALMTGATLCLISARVLRVSRELDATAARVNAVVAEQGAARGRLAARARVASFVHDDVLAALRGASEAVVGTAEAVRLQARRATAVIAVESESDDWIDRLRVLADEAGAHFTVERVARAVVPGEHVKDAVVVAARQALDNSVRHAGTCTRSVRLEVGGAGLVLWIVDDGVGFSAPSIPPGRLGIATSIEGAMRDLAGGDARVASAPGRGTTVELRWDEESGPDVHFAEPPSFRRPVFSLPGVLAIAALFVLTQTLVAAAGVSAEPGAGWWPLAVLAGILAATALVLPIPPGRASRGVAVVVVLGVTILGGLLATPPPLTYGSAWFIPAAGFVLVAVAFDARPALAVVGLVPLLLLLVADASVRGGDLTQIVSIVVRTATIVGLGALFAASIVRMRRSTRAIARRAASATQQREWDRAAQHEIEARRAELDELAGPLLARIASGEQLSADDRARARALEGRLRDGYRAGRLLHPSLIEAAVRARIRGVDVVLLDDAGQAEIDAVAAATIAEWMQGVLDEAHRRFVGRLLPPGRATAAQVVVDGSARNFPG
ncbi:MAG: hypothetical protein DI573_01630 [Microbacterium sp.]|uniref:sensor histidine kinase n=1 Tax=Microbacterium sp. TaxID=51671 RepID=UPI000DB37862|nr:ATP-binding protein [Microbacterium sp.]PZU41263.1 MAG: hypothetical protein DI573_01630 [Microbacterium sp.]